MNYDQFSGEDSQIAKDLTLDGRRLFERRAVLKRFLSYTNTSNQVGGVVPQRNVVLIEQSMGEKVMSGRDLLSSGGIYQEGDLEEHTSDPVFGADNRNVTEADRMFRDGQEFVQVGLPYAVPMAGGRLKYISHWRRES